MSTPKPPQERICIGGADGSPSCGHGEHHQRRGGCTAPTGEQGRPCLHRCTFAQEPTPQRHDGEHIGIKCRLCKRGANEINGYLHRVNEKGVLGIWECRPYCLTNISNEEAVMRAITGEEDAE